MKKCPKCEKRYDDSWGVCLNDGERLVQLNPEAVKREAEERRIEAERQKYEEEHWEEKLQDEMADELGISKEELKENLKKQSYPRWIRICAIILATIVIFSIYRSARYFKGAVLLQKYRESTNIIDQMEYLKAILKAVPESKTAWKELIYISYSTGEEDLVVEKLNNLRFSDDEKKEIGQKVKNICYSRKLPNDEKKRIVKQKLKEILS